MINVYEGIKGQVTGANQGQGSNSQLVNPSPNRQGEKARFVGKKLGEINPAAPRLEQSYDVRQHENTVDTRMKKIWKDNCLWLVPAAIVLIPLSLISLGVIPYAIYHCTKAYVEGEIRNELSDALKLEKFNFTKGALNDWAGDQSTPFEQHILAYVDKHKNEYQKLFKETPEQFVLIVSQLRNKESTDDYKIGTSILKIWDDLRKTAAPEIAAMGKRTAEHSNIKKRIQELANRPRHEKDKLILQDKLNKVRNDLANKHNPNNQPHHEAKVDRMLLDIMSKGTLQLNFYLSNLYYNDEEFKNRIIQFNNENDWDETSENFTKITNDSYNMTNGEHYSVQRVQINPSDTNEKPIVAMLSRDSNSGLPSYSIKIDKEEAKPYEAMSELILKKDENPNSRTSEHRSQISKHIEPLYDLASSIANKEQLGNEKKEELWNQISFSLCQTYLSGLAGTSFSSFFSRSKHNRLTENSEAFDVIFQGESQRLVTSFDYIYRTNDKLIIQIEESLEVEKMGDYGSSLNSKLIQRYEITFDLKKKSVMPEFKIHPLRVDPKNNVFHNELPVSGSDENSSEFGLQKGTKELENPDGFINNLPASLIVKTTNSDDDST